MSTANITLYAKWYSIFTITFNSNGGSTVPPVSNIISGSLINKPTDPTKTNYSFGGWYKESTLTNEWYFSTDTVNYDIILYAKWNVEAIFDLNGGSGIIPTPYILNEGSNIVLPYNTEFSKEGYAFGLWNTQADGNGINYNPGSSYIVNTNITLYAIWIANYGVITVPGASLSAKLAWLKANAANEKEYIIELIKNENLFSTSLNYANNITITLRGIGATRTISHFSTTANMAMFSISSGVTLVLDEEITLQGRNDNTASLVYTYSSGSLIMNTGSKIIGNNIDRSIGYSTALGGGVYNGGTFTMTGGEISGNTITSTSLPGSSSANYGGGVYNVGTFIMTGGEISGNTITGYFVNFGGAGVYSNGTFDMSGGKISGNISSPLNTNPSYGGGVYIGGGTFTMSGDSEISGNTSASTSSSYGGGVSVHGDATFTMSGGKISGNINRINYTTSSTNTFGNGVFVDGTLNTAGGTFNMTGGEISGNTFSSVAYGTGCRGGGVFVYTTRGSFSKIGGGIIYGRNEGTNSNIANINITGSGDAVYRLDGSNSGRRDTTLGISDDINSSITTSPPWGM